VAAAVVGGLWFAVSHTARHVAAGRRHRVLPTGVFSVLPRLAMLQVAVFIGMEVSERLAAGAPLSTIVDHRVLVIGVGVQLLVAGVLAFACHALGRAGAALGRAIAARPAIAARHAVSSPKSQVLPMRLAVAPCGSRGPPLS
jgi:hypothetical protein